MSVDYDLLQLRVLEVQRLALVFAEAGHMDVARALMSAGMRAAKIKPDRLVEPGTPSKVAKGKSA